MKKFEITPKCYGQKLLGYGNLYAFKKPRKTPPRKPRAVTTRVIDAATRIRMSKALQDPGNVSELEIFAKYLLETEQYELALTCRYRILFILMPDNINCRWHRYYRALTLLLLGRYTKSYRIAEALLKELEHTEFYELRYKVQLVMADSLHLLEQEGTGRKGMAQIAYHDASEFARASGLKIIRPLPTCIGGKCIPTFARYMHTG